MAHSFGSLVFTPAVQALQDRYGSRRQYAKMRTQDASPDSLGPPERQFLEESDSFYIATVGATGWPYIQHRGGPPGFLKVLDETTVAFADFRGNKQFISTGNLATDNRVALILVDYPRRTRLKILGHAEIREGDPTQDSPETLHDPAYRAVVERVFVIRVAAFDWNCQQHITPRFTAAQIKEVLQPVEKQMAELVQENERLRGELARAHAHVTPFPTAGNG